MVEHEIPRTQIIAWLLGESDAGKANMATLAIQRALNGHAAAIAFETTPDIIRGVVSATQEEARSLGRTGLDALGDPVFRQQLLPTLVINEMPPEARIV